jgi:hypothetical protein
MARPAKPAVGDLIEASFASELRSYASEAMEFVRMQQTTWSWDLNGATGNGSAQELELLRLPANDDRIAYALVQVMVRGAAAGDNMSLSIKASATSASLDGVAYNTGTVGRGGASGPFMARLGGANKRSIWWNGSNGSTCWILLLGYWRRVG